MQGKIIANRELFARKLVRGFGGVIDSDIENEARVIRKLREYPHRNIMGVLKHGRLPSPNSTLYYTDMILCQKSLHDHIQISVRTGTLPIDLYRGDRHNRHFFHKMVETVFIISLDIIRGLDFLHSLHEVHKNIKPKNSILQPFPR